MGGRRRAGGRRRRWLRATRACVRGVGFFGRPARAARRLPPHPRQRVPCAQSLLSTQPHAGRMRLALGARGARAAGGEVSRGRAPGPRFGGPPAAPHARAQQGPARLLIAGSPRCLQCASARQQRQRRLPGPGRRRCRVGPARGRPRHAAPPDRPRWQRAQALSPPYSGNCPEALQAAPYSSRPGGARRTPRAADCVEWGGRRCEGPSRGRRYETAPLGARGSWLHGAHRGRAAGRGV
jgi:hypothetical protein